MSHPRVPELGRCRLFHRWTKWGALKVGNALWGGKQVGDFLYQQRTCQRCNRVQQRQVA